MLNITSTNCQNMLLRTLPEDDFRLVAERPVKFARNQRKLTATVTRYNRRCGNVRFLTLRCRAISFPRVRVLIVSQRHRGDTLMSSLSCGPLRLAILVPDEDLDALSDVFCRTLVVGKHAFLRREGDRSDLVRILQSGLGIRHKTSQQGSRQIVGILMPGHICDLSSLFFDDPDHSIETVTDCAVAVARRDQVLDLMDKRPAIARAFLARSLADASVAREWVMNVGRRTGYQRVAHLLCEISACSRNLDFADNLTCAFPLTQEELADATGLTVVYVNRALQDLRRRELISLRQNLLTVHDWQGLCAEADFSQSYLHYDSQTWDLGQKSQEKSRYDGAAV